MTRSGAGRTVRLAKALAAYAVVGAVVWAAVEPVRRTFLLPELFTTLARAFVLIVLPVIMAAAWRYPELGAGPPDDEGHGS